jgi:hypothetical protein
VNAVAQQGMRAEQAVMGVNVQIILPFRKQLARPGHFFRGFRDMGLYPAVRVFGGQLAGKFQLARRTGGRKAWGDGIAQAPLAVPACDERA